MKILLLHPKDRVEDGPWRDTHWDWIVDLGWAGHCAYAELADRLHCKASSIRDIPDHQRHLSRLRESWNPGFGKLVDKEGVDWWDLFFPVSFDRIEEILLMSTLSQQIPADAELVASRPHSLVRTLSALLHREIKSFVAAGDGLLARYGKAASTFHLWRLGEIALDKWDADYRLRRRFSPTPTKLTAPVILLPSSYVNVTRAQVDYARMLPQQRFLLVVTRRNGGLADLPANVELRSLASYAPAPFLPATESECDHLLENWRALPPKLDDAGSVLSLASKLGVFDGFPAFLRKALRIRDAWRAVLANEPIRAVLCGDENNPYTRLPTLLARSKGVHTVGCEHGALNMTFSLRPAVSSVYLARGEMDRDYWMGFCGMHQSEVRVGSAAAPPAHRNATAKRDWIVYFSEAYEVSSGRTADFYRELLPRLATLANETNRKVVVKLHPFESLRERSRLVKKAVPGSLQPLVELREGPLTPDLFERAWFAVTVESSVAVESTLQGVPCFLCHWFDASWYEYAAQFAKFSAGRFLESPEEISNIPALLEGFEITQAQQQRLATQISRDELEAVLYQSL